nr:MAG TPA: hypothetical protein [Caudoviricetes sp.]
MLHSILSFPTILHSFFNYFFLFCIISYYFKLYLEMWKKKRSYLIINSLN